MAYTKDSSGEDFFALQTFRRDGRAVSTPIWLVRNENRWYAYTPARSWKVRRLRANPRVRFAPSDYHGTPHGEWRDGWARVVPVTGELRRIMCAKYGRKYLVFTVLTRLGRLRRAGGPPVGLEISATG